MCSFFVELIKFARGYTAGDAVMRSGGGSSILTFSLHRLNVVFLLFINQQNFYHKYIDRSALSRLFLTPILIVIVLFCINAMYLPLMVGKVVSNKN